MERYVFPTYQLTWLLKFTLQHEDMMVVLAIKAPMGPYTSSLSTRAGTKMAPMGPYSQLLLLAVEQILFCIQTCLLSSSAPHGI